MPNNSNMPDTFHIKTVPKIRICYKQKEVAVYISFRRKGLIEVTVEPRSSVSQRQTGE